MSATGALALSAVTSLAESGEAAAALPRAMKRLPWRTPDGPRGVPGLPPSCTRRAVTAATLRAAGSKFLFDGCVIVPAEPSSAPRRVREASERRSDWRLTFPDHLGTSWMSAEAHPRRQTPKSVRGPIRNP